MKTSGSQSKRANPTDKENLSTGSSGKKNKDSSKKETKPSKKVYKLPRATLYETDPNLLV